MKIARRQKAMTLLEVVVAVTLTVGLMGSVLWFYNSAAKTRSSVMRQAEEIAGARLVMDRMTQELRASLSSSFLSMAMEGMNDSVSFLTTKLPCPSAWAEVELTRQQPPPQHDVQLVGYRLRTSTDEEGQEQVDGLERTVQKLLYAKQVDEAQDVQAHLICPHVKFLRLRYWDGSAWLETWSGGQLPAAVEITLGTQPFDESSEGQEYPYDAFRRTVYIPAGRIASAQPGGLVAGGVMP